ncbi:MAG: proline--tRNA ligase [Candidatus Aenigmarchaeota archaeon]|nr:proline--tRNA ligase [Candidatus Aenigmarchaeota archaeon]
MSEELGMTVKKSEKFMDWYYEVLQKAEVVDIRFKAKGFDVYLPTAMRTIREMERLFAEELDAKGHLPVMFPIIIPESNLKTEEEHIKGFAREVFWITHAGANKLEEKFALRPTSETAMYPMYSLWLRSHLQLPMKFYQSGRVWRYETKMTRPLLRPREFRWFETHCAFKTDVDVIKQIEQDMDIFKKIVNDSFCIPFLMIKRTQWDKFPGAEDTYAFETVMPDGKVLQIGTTHDLGQKFAKVFDVKYLDEDGKKKYVYQTCYGPGITRMLGAIVCIHGDDKGLIIPPAIAPVQVVIVPIYTGNTKTEVMKKAGELLGSLAEKDFRVDLDYREQYTPGFKFHEWELKGVPVRIEIGPKDIEKGVVTIVRRDFRERIQVPEEKLEEHLLEVMDSISAQLLKRANERMKIEDAKDLKELKEDLKKGGFVRIEFCGEEKCAEKFKDDTGAEVRGTLFGNETKAKGKCAICGKKAKEVAYVGEGY